jgi:hypothetical protein
MGSYATGKCYTNALIPFYDSNDYDALLKEAKESNPDFALECERATIQAIHAFQEAESGVLCEQLPKMPVKFSALPYHEYIHDNTPMYNPFGPLQSISCGTST